MNKHERATAGRKRAARLARDCGWTGKFDELPSETRKAFLSRGKIRLGGDCGDSKGFSRGPRAKGTGATHLNNKLASARESVRAAWDEACMKPTTNAEQRELGRFVKRPKKNLNSR